MRITVQSKSDEILNDLVNNFGEMGSTSTSSFTNVSTDQLSAITENADLFGDSGFSINIQ